MLYFVLAALLVAVDQWVKYLVSTNISLGGTGKIADLVFVDDKFNVSIVMQEGEICKFKYAEE